MPGKLRKLYKKHFETSKLRYSERPFSVLEDTIGFQLDKPISSPTSIPPAVYQTWETNSFGKRHRQAMLELRELNRPIDFFVFDTPSVDQYMHAVWTEHPILEIYQKATLGPMRADIFRYCIVYERGGYYIDINKGIKRPLKDFHNERQKGLITFEQSVCNILPDDLILNNFAHPDRYVAQWAFGFAKQHPFLQRLIENIVSASPFFTEKCFADPKSAILQLTGPGMFTRTLRQYAFDNGLIDIAQAGVNFDGTAVFELPGARARFGTVPHYTSVKNSPILS